MWLACEIFYYKTLLCVTADFDMLHKAVVYQV